MKGLVKNCIKSVLESNFNLPYEIIVVDNASNDGIASVMKEKFPQVKFIASQKNIGMGGGNNIGIKQANGKYVLILNPDIHVFPDSIQKLYDYIKERDEIGLISPKLLNPDRSLQHTCYRWHNLLTPIYRRTFFSKFKFAKRDISRFIMEDWDHLDTLEVDWIQGSCLLIPKHVLDKAGLFDEQYFMYFEDTDLCRRIKKAGFQNVYHPHSEVIHFHRRQSADGNILFNKMTRTHIISWLKYMRKWKESLS